MAEVSRSPSLPSTADEVAYAPVSWLAVGSVAAAGLFVLSLVFFGLDAFRGKKSLIMPELLLFAGVAIVLSFAARRVVRTSEGTRTGEKLTNIAWWVSVVVGIVYVAYWLAIEYAIRRDAKEEVRKWVASIVKGEFAQAFHRTLEPGRRVKIAPNDEGKMKAEFREPVLAFRQYDLLRLAARNPDLQFESGGLRDWQARGKTVECVFTGTVKCAEGTFPIHVPLKATEGLTAVDAGGGRQWQINPGATGFFQIERVTYTRYGWLTQLLEGQGAMIGRQFVIVSGSGPGLAPYAYHAYVKPEGPGGWGRVVAMCVFQPDLSRWLVTAIPQTPDYIKFQNEQLLRTPTGAEPTLPHKTLFLKAWNTSGVVPAGTRIKNSPEKYDFLTYSVDAEKKVTRVEVRVPIEIPTPRPDSDMAAARGRVVVECTDPAALELVNQLRGNADPNQPLLIPPEEYRKLSFKWRVRGIESDMDVVTVQRPDGPPSGGAPPPPG